MTETNMGRGEGERAEIRVVKGWAPSFPDTVGMWWGGKGEGRSPRLQEGENEGPGEGEEGVRAAGAQKEPERFRVPF